MTDGAHAPRTPLQAGAEFFRTEAASGTLLMAAAVVAMVWANLAADSYGALGE